MGYILQHIACDDVIGGAAGALDGDLFIVVEEFVGFFTPTAEDRKDAFDGAAAVEAKLAGF